MTTPTTTSAAQLYLGAVDRELSDLPLDARTDLVEDLALHLAALEQEGDDRPYELRLGTPVAYATELRSAAGLPPRAGGPVQPVPTVHQLRQDWQRLADSPAGQEVLAFLPLLVPAWWVLRAMLLVAALSLPVGFGLPSLVLLIPAVLGSIALGRRQLPPTPRRVIRVAEVAVTVGALLLLTTGSSGVDYVYVDDGAPASASEAYPLLSTAGPVTDIFPYSSAGVPLEGVLLFDQDGRPLRVGAQEWWPDDCRRTALAPRAADGVPVPFSYPQNYVLDGETTLYGGAVEPGQCQQLSRPQVPLPVFAAATPVPTPSPSASPLPEGSPSPSPAVVGPS